jgi:TRAP transporter TAXI family solute receptor
VYTHTYGVESVVQSGIKEAWPEFRMLMGTECIYWGWMVLPETGIRAIPELKGHSVSYIIPGSDIKRTTAAASLRAAGLDPEKDVKHIRFDNTPASVDGLQRKKVEAIFGSISGSRPDRLKAMVGAILLPFPQELFDRLPSDLKKVMVLRKLPTGYAPLVDNNQTVIGHPKVLICRSDLSEQAAYLIVKSIMEHAPELEKVGAMFKEIGEKEIALTLDFPVPFHPGAMRYFKEAGMWASPHEARQRELLHQLPR